MGGVEGNKKRSVRARLCADILAKAPWACKGPAMQRQTGCVQLHSTVRLCFALLRLHELEPGSERSLTAVGRMRLCAPLRMMLACQSCPGQRGDMLRQGCGRGAQKVCRTV